jgi:tetratricopeptide (TPR) repeat protein
LNEKFQPIYREENGVKMLANPKMENWNSWVANWNSAIQSGTWYIADFKKQGNSVDTLKKAGLKPENIVKNVNHVSEFTVDNLLKAAGVLYKEGDFKRAETVARQAIALDKNNSAAWMTLSKALIETDKDNILAFKEYDDCPQEIICADAGAYLAYFATLSLYKDGKIDTKLADGLKVWLNKITDPKLRALYEKLIREIETAQQQAQGEPFEEPCE